MPLPPSPLLILLMPLLWAGSLALDRRYLLHMQKSVTVQEGLCVLVPCNVSYPQDGWVDSTPAFGYWFQEGADQMKYLVATNHLGHKVEKETKGRFFLLGDPKKFQCSLDIRDAKREDTKTYLFRVERGSIVKYSFTDPQLSVHVTALTHTPDIHIQGILQAGHPSSINCSVPWACERGTPPSFFWIWGTLTSMDPSTPLSSVLTLIPRLQDHGSNLTCRVTFPGAGVTVERTVQLNVTRRPEPMAEVVLVTIWEAAAKSLLLTFLLLLCLIFLLLKFCRSKEGRP